MDIKYFGHASFFIKTKIARVVTDPYDSKMVGLKFPKVEADIVTVSHHHQDHDRAELVTGDPLVIYMSGEYEKKGVRVFGYQSFHDKKKGAERGENILYKIESEGISLLHCGDLGLVPEESFLELIGEVDILMVPVGGFYTIDPQESANLSKKIEASIIIPMHYNNPKLNQEIFGKLSPVGEFLKNMGIETATPIPKLTVKKEDLGNEEMKVVVMEISN